MSLDLIEILSFFSFAFGACVASFLNVVIWRVPRGESIVSPPSHCPKCGAAIRWYQNVPILSWLALRGKCANCKHPISPRYILIELLGGVLFLAVFWRFVPNLFSVQGALIPFQPGIFFVGGGGFALCVAWTWIALMIVGSMIDFDHKLLPDFVTVGGMVLGVVVGTGDSVGLLRAGDALWWQPIVWSLGGLAFGFGLLWLVRWLGTKVFRREAMGMGDVFLMGAVGALYGPVAVLVTLILSSVFGSIVGVGMIVLAKAKLGRFVEIPYGPYICLGCLCWMFWGAELVGWYLGLMGARG